MSPRDRLSPARMVIDAMADREITSAALSARCAPLSPVLGQLSIEMFLTGGVSLTAYSYEQIEKALDLPSGLLGDLDKLHCKHFGGA